MDKQISCIVSLLQFVTTFDSLQMRLCISLILCKVLYTVSTTRQMLANRGDKSNLSYLQNSYVGPELPYQASTVTIKVQNDVM